MPVVSENNMKQKCREGKKERMDRDCIYHGMYNAMVIFSHGYSESVPEVKHGLGYGQKIGLVVEHFETDRHGYEYNYRHAQGKQDAGIICA